ncbi:MAG: GlsB/YeaQ/YmgE family stress response membrane protein [Burkholderiaceae bacterium]|nr:GlsB/YeaQ/YmgE family stress response membrane protein [Burkholderiaceae bacterium]MEB2317974.1 GlsB/YeaQ/YmgE family stress response membrane protein [Pseudomonadota bacterium]
MAFIQTVVVGLIVGAIAKFIMPGKQGGGIIITSLLGIVGAVVATYLGQAVGIYGPDEGARWVGSVVGALIVLFVYGLITKKKA